MYYAFFDESTQSPKTLITCAVVVPQQKYSESFQDLRALQKSRQHIEIMSDFLERLDGIAVVWETFFEHPRLNAERSRPFLFSDTLKPVAVDNWVWTNSLFFTVMQALVLEGFVGKRISTVDVYYDNRELTRDNEYAIGRTFQGKITDTIRKISDEHNVVGLKNTRVRRVKKISKPTGGDYWSATKFQQGTRMPHVLMCQADEIKSNQAALRRIRYFCDSPNVTEHGNFSPGRPKKEGVYQGKPCFP